MEATSPSSQPPDERTSLLTTSSSPQSPTTDNTRRSLSGMEERIIWLMRPPSPARGRATRLGSPPPLTPYPRWTEEEERRAWSRTNAMADGVVIAVQCAVIFGVAAAVVCVSFQGGKESYKMDTWVWDIIMTGLAFTFLMQGIIFCLHIDIPLTPVVHLVMQSMFLTSTTIVGSFMWEKYLVESQQEMRVVLAVGTALVCGCALFGFLRGLVLWWIEEEE